MTRQGDLLVESAPTARMVPEPASPVARLVRSASRLALRTYGRAEFSFGRYYNAVERLGFRLGSGPVLARLPTGQLISCDLRDHIQRQIYYFGCYEPVESYLFSFLLADGFNVVDGGANIGQYTLIASSLVGARGSVHSFEPIGTNYRRLCEHLASNRVTNAVPVQAGLWSEAKRLSLAADTDPSINSGSFGAGIQGGHGSTHCDAIALDDYVESAAVKRVDLVKLDIEGSELFALRGMRQTLRRDHPTVLMEVNREAATRLGYRPEDTCRLMREFGYRVWLIGASSKECRPITSLAGIERANVIFHYDRLPKEVVGDWGVADVMRWANGRWQIPKQ